MGNAVHVQHPLLKPGTIEFRGYQANLARLATQRDTLVVVPTGMGKTVVALLAIADALRSGARRILVLAPTRPLVLQHADFFAGVLAEPWGAAVVGLTGTQGVEKRSEAYTRDGIVVATPQVIQNDVVGGRLDLASFNWVVFDEAHRAVGDYPYAFLGMELQRRAPSTRRLALTASPGHDVRKIEEVRSNLGLSAIEIRTPADPDVAPYVQQVDVEYETLPLPPVMGRVSKLLHEALSDRIRALRAMGHLKQAGSRPGRRDLLELGGRLQQLVGSSTQPDPNLFVAMSVQAQAMKIRHAIEQCETQGAAAFVEYLEGLRSEATSAKATKATKNIVDDPRLNQAYHVARHDESENPKMGRAGVLVQEQLERNPAARVILFTHYRSTCEAVVAHLAKLPGVKPVVFVGQSKRGAQAGMTQKQQQAVLDTFRAGAVNVLVATSVAEEGLDIPETDLVVFFEPIPSEIRSIQRRGRTGRKSAGRVIVLITKGTQDEAAHFVSRRKEQAMVQELTNLRYALSQGLSPSPPRASVLQALDVGEGATAWTSSSAHLALEAPLAATTGATPLPRAEPTTQGAAAPPAMTSSTLGSFRDGAPAATASTSTGPTRAVASGQKRLADLDAAPPTATRGSGGAKVYYDLREQSGGTVRHLHELGASLEGRQLEVGDFILSDRVAVERKTCADFVESLLDGRLFKQMQELRSYPRPFLVVEGDSLFGHRNVSPDALYAALASITVDMGIPVLQTRDGLETARFLWATAKREQERDGRKLALRSAKPTPLDEQQRFFIEGLPGVSAVLARRLLERFGSPSNVLTASVDQLATVEGIGEGKAHEMRRILDAAYVRRGQ